uniref:Uncharacterized protein n=1 Tax=Rangifer tarandus platyrhynchus TaxID=3082113 RepID=A0ACB0F493_RANTA|nr:unnamed protein product [Rangifer tarandus platyrhynchus]
MDAGPPHPLDVFLSVSSSIRMRTLHLASRNVLSRNGFSRSRGNARQTVSVAPRACGQAAGEVQLGNRSRGGCFVALVASAARLGLELGQSDL